MARDKKTGGAADAMPEQEEMTVVVLKFKGGRRVAQALDLAAQPTWWVPRPLRFFAKGGYPTVGGGDFVGSAMQFANQDTTMV